MDGASVPSALDEVRHRILLVTSRRKELLLDSGAHDEPCVSLPRLVAVSKKHEAKRLLGAYESGQRVFGENFVQELIDKACKMPSDVQWHFIGKLQSNKVKALILGVRNLSVVETLDSLKLARKLNSACEEAKRRTPLGVFIQINTSEEDSKGGLIWLAEYIMNQCPQLQLRGLMTIGAVGDLTCFDRLVNCRSVLEGVIPPLNERLELSMGMSADFEEAIQKGSTNVRVGSSIFGGKNRSLIRGSMVLLHVKRSDKDSFLVETSVTESNDDLIRRLVRIWNLRLRIMVLVGVTRDLAEYGPTKPESKQGVDDIRARFQEVSIDEGDDYKPDPTGKRCGNGVSPQLKDTINRVCRDAEIAVDQAMVLNKQAITENILQEKLDNIRGAVSMAFPMGLPEWDPAQLCIDDGKGALEGFSTSNDTLEESTAQLWMAAKEFKRHEKVGDRLGMNEKTKVICKLRSPEGGPPAREPAVSEDERKAMMAFYFKKQEDMKRLADSNDDDYLSSPWADSKQLKRNLQGTGGVKAPGIRHH